MSELLCVLGYPKTASSNLVGILNCHPDIFMLYETNLRSSAMSRYAGQLVDAWPETRGLVYAEQPIAVPYAKLGDMLREKYGRDYRYVGDKFAGEPVANFTGLPGKVIFSLRDIRTWLAKGSVQSIYQIESNIVPIAIDFTAFLMRTHLVPHGVRVKMEDLLGDDTALFKQLDDYLGLDLTKHADQWWQDVGNYKSSDPKSLQSWAKGHPSSTTKPSGEDTAAQLADHPFWDAILPLFDKYYQADGCHSSAEVEADLTALAAINKIPAVRLDQAFDGIETRSISKSKKKKFGIF